MLGSLIVLCPSGIPVPKVPYPALPKPTLPCPPLTHSPIPLRNPPLFQPTLPYFTTLTHSPAYIHTYIHACITYTAAGQLKGFFQQMFICSGLSAKFFVCQDLKEKGGFCPHFFSFSFMPLFFLFLFLSFSPFFFFPCFLFLCAFSLRR